MMDTSLCREHLERLLLEETTALEQLETLLEKEHRLIVSNDIEGLDSAGRERETCIGALLRIDSERQTLCRMAGYGQDKFGLLSLLKWADASGSLQQRWKSNTASIRRTRMLNDRNGALVNNRLKRVEGMLDTLNGQQTRDARVYTARGSAYQQTQAGRVCNMEA